MRVIERQALIARQLVSLSHRPISLISASTLTSRSFSVSNRHKMTMDSTSRLSPERSTRTVLVVGASYGGHRAAQHLVTLLPSSWRVVVLERNTHFNHLYAFPRISVVPGHEQKAFIPYTKIFEPQPPLSAASSTANRIIHGSLTAIRQTSSSDIGHDGAPSGRGIAHYRPLDLSEDTLGDQSRTDQQQTCTIAFDFLIYALGSHLPPPINVWSVPAKKVQGLTTKTTDQADTMVKRRPNGPPGSKVNGMEWLRDAQQRIAEAESVLVIGGGALGVQFASDIAWVYGTPTSAARWTGNDVYRSKPKRVTLLSSSPRLLPRFQPWMHEQAYEHLTGLGIDILTGARADLSTLGDSLDGQQRYVRTLDGRQVEADVVLFCTGQRPNTELLRGLEQGGGGNSRFLNPANGAAFVTPYLQLCHSDRARRSELEHIFVVGDAADAFGALHAGHTAFAQADVAARNVARLVARQEGKFADASHVSGNGDAASHPLLDDLEEYEPEPHKIKVSVGLERAIIENTGQHKISEGGKEDLNTPNMWVRRGLATEDMFV